MHNFQSVFLFGVVNASPDSLNTDSIVDGPTRRAPALGNCSPTVPTPSTSVGRARPTSPPSSTGSDEWARLEAIVPALAALDVDVSIDSWRPEVVRRALQAGANVINAADGMQSDEMWQVATEFDAPIVVPFLSGPNPRAMTQVRRDPVEAIVEFFAARLADADRYGLRHRCIVDPGTGFAPPEWAWEDRYVYQKRVYTNLGELRRFGLPLYIALPWKETAQHDELLEIVVRQQPEYGRAHYPAKVRRFERRAEHH